MSAVGAAATAGAPGGPWDDAARRRLVRVCRAITGDAEAAEDLAQETLLEAWRHRAKLRDPSGSDRWLAAIARNVCLRWARRRGRDPLPVAEPGPDGAAAAEHDLDHGDLAALVDRALGTLPVSTRDVLVQRLVHAAPPAEVAGRLGISEDAVSMRLARGKQELRRLLASELRDEAAALRLAGEACWQPTRVWCPACGARRLLQRRDPSGGGAIAFRCPGCEPDASAADVELRLSNPVFAAIAREVTRPTAILARVAEWSHGYYALAVSGGGAPCTRCGRAAPVRTYERPRAGHAASAGLYVECGCGEVVSNAVGGLALSHPAVRAFRRAARRTRLVPARCGDVDGVPAVAVRCEAVGGPGGVEVVFDRRTLRTLAARPLAA